MYRVSPLSYFVSGIISVGLAGQEIRCDKKDIVVISEVPSGSTCATYLAPYFEKFGGYLLSSTDDSLECHVCPFSTTDNLIGMYGIKYSHRWLDWGVTIAYSCANIGLAFLLWWLVHGSKKSSRKN